jgi:hypothetical protein
MTTLWIYLTHLICCYVSVKHNQCLRVHHLHFPTSESAKFYHQVKQEGCLESIQPFGIYGEPVKWPWCNLAASQRRLYCASVNRGSPVGLVSWQWDAVNWACVMCGRRNHKSPQYRRRFLALGKARSSREPNLGCRGADRPARCDALPKKILHKNCRMGRCIVVMKLICSLCHCECDGHTVHKLS